MYALALHVYRIWVSLTVIWPQQKFWRSSVWRILQSTTTLTLTWMWRLFILLIFLYVFEPNLWLLDDNSIECSSSHTLCSRYMTLCRTLCTIGSQITFLEFFEALLVCAEVKKANLTEAADRSQSQTSNADETIKTSGDELKGSSFLRQFASPHVRVQKSRQFLQ